MAKEDASVELKQFTGMEDIIGLFADAYLISHSGGAFTLYFFQSQISPTTLSQEPQKMEIPKFGCVARISLSEASFDKLLAAMEKNKKSSAAKDSTTDEQE